MPRFALSLALLFAALPAYCSNTFTYATIDYPGAAATQARGINYSGEIVGFFYDSTSCSDYNLQVPNCPTHGFKLVKGQYTELNIPGSISTAAMGVNDGGDIVEFYENSDGTRHGFLWKQTNVIETIDYPNTTYFTVPMAIDSTQQIVGGLWSTSQTGTFAVGGWVWINGAFSVMDLGTTGCYYCTSVNGISNNGIIVGQAFRNDFWTGWLKKGTDNDFFKNGGGDTFTTSVNNNTDIVGYSAFGGAWFAKNIEQNEGSPEKEKSPVYITVQYPNSLTYPFGMNLSRAVVGTYNNSGTLHGFLATPNF